ncbi:MAG: MFS transporter [Deltaproteobacteria bacterium]|nr:MFS transporter [Deltaproteobacteria bacterium]
MTSALSRPNPAPSQRVGPSAATGPQHRGIFYGWVIVGCAFTILCIAYGLQFSFGVFMPYISADTGWDRGALSLPFSVYVFVYSALGLVSGRLTDRWGPRVVLITGGCLLGIGTMLISRVGVLWQLYVVLGLLAASGMSAAYVPCNATVVRWFSIRRGLALSIASAGASFGMFVFPPLSTALIAGHGWRGAYFILGLLAVCTIVMCASFVVRDPAAIGLHPDGLSQDLLSELQVTARIADEQSFTLREARRTRAFWLVNLIFGLTWLVVFMPMVHIVPFAIDMGISPFRAAMTIGVIGFAGFGGRLTIGTLSDRFGRMATLGACLVLQALSFAGFTVSSELVLLYVAAGMFGFSYGGVTALFPALVGDFFRLAEIGSIVGFIFAVAGSSAAFGPLIAGFIYNSAHTYTAAFDLSAGLNLTALFLLFLLKKPEKYVPETASR